MITSQVHLVMPAHVNSTNRLFGGQLMAWIDIVAAVEARRHAKCSVTTVTVDHLEFLAPAFLGDMVLLEAQVTWTGRTSIEVLVESYVEELSGEKTLINRAYLVFVAIGEKGLPCSFPAYAPSTPAQMEEWKAAEKRREYRLSMRHKK